MDISSASTSEQTLHRQHHGLESINLNDLTGNPQPSGKRKWLGLDNEQPIKMHPEGSANLMWPRVRTTFQEPFSEFMGVMVLVMFYYGAQCQAVLSEGATTAPGGNGYGTYMSVPWGTGIGVMVGIYISGDSGSYLNPAITFANHIFRGLPWRRLPIIIFSQFLGAFVGTGIIYANYVSAIDHYAGQGVRGVPPSDGSTAGLFTTFPTSFSGLSSRAFSIIIPSALAVVATYAMKDDYNNGVSKAGGNFFPVGMFFLVYGLGVSFGWETGGATNPAVDFSGRLMANVVGYPRELWTNYDYYFWMPLVLPFVGAVFGGFLYDLMVFTGPSPINAPYFGLKNLMFPRNKISREMRHERKRASEDPNTNTV